MRPTQQDLDTPSTPRQRLRVIDALYPRSLVSAAYNALKFAYIPPSTFFLPRDAVMKDRSPALLSEYLPAPVATFLCEHLLTLTRLIHRKILLETRGFEFWVGITGNNARSFGYLHVDNDEHLRAQTGEVRNPMVGSVFYLGPSAGMRGGETAFVRHARDATRLSTFHHHPAKAIKAVPSACAVSPRPGRLVLFDGRLPHAVLPAKLASGHSPRVTLLVNLWAERLSSVPSGVCSMRAEDYLGKGPHAAREQPDA